MSRFKFDTSAAHVVVSPDGYFDVFASASHPAHERPAYRGELNELGRAVVEGDRLVVRPGSAAMRAAVLAWAAKNGPAAVSGSLGKGRQGGEALPVKDGAKKV